MTIPEFCLLHNHLRTRGMVAAQRGRLGGREESLCTAAVKPTVCEAVGTWRQEAQTNRYGADSLEKHSLKP